MNKIIILFFFICSNLQAIDNSIILNSLLKENVIYSESKSLVNYKKLKNNKEPLIKYLTEIESINKADFENLNTNKQLAYLINYYNILTIKLIIEHYPLKSIKDLTFDKKSAWDFKLGSLFGKNVTLNEIENDYIRKKYNNNLIHFALVCAAKSCPRLINKLYTEDNLSKELNDAASTFLDDQDNNFIDKKNKTIFISKIFDWYKQDFPKDKELIKFLNRFKKEKFDINYKVKFSNYNWDLNKY